MFAVLGDVAEGDEIELRQVLTWASVDLLEEQLGSGLPMMSKEVGLGEMGSSLHVGVRLQVGADDAWLVKLGNDRAVPKLQAQDRLTFLAATFEGSGNAKVWRLHPRPTDRVWLHVAQTGLRMEADA